MSPSCNHYISLPQSTPRTRFIPGAFAFVVRNPRCPLYLPPFLKFAASLPSYGTVEKPTPQASLRPCTCPFCEKIIRHLWDNWGKDSVGLRNGEIDLYSVNIPMVQGLLSEDGLPIIWTRLWRNTYHRLFKACSPERAADLERPSLSAGPDSAGTVPAQTISQEAGGKVIPERLGGLLFEFSPDMKEFVNLSPASLPEGSDSWAIEMGWANVTPMRASFGEPPAEDVFPPGGTTQDKIWKIRL